MTHDEINAEREHKIDVFNASETHQYIASIFRAIYPHCCPRVAFDDENESFIVVVPHHTFIFHVSSDDDNFAFFDTIDSSIRVMFPIP